MVRRVARPGGAFVNSRFGMTFYGSNRVDCRCSLRDWTRLMGTVFSQTDATKPRSGYGRAAAGFSSLDGLR